MKNLWRMSVMAALTGYACLPSGNATAQQTQQALFLVRAVCTLPNASLDLRRTAQGRLDVTIQLAGGQRRTVTLVRSDTDTFLSGAVDLKMRESLDVIQCMTPYLDEVSATLPSLPERPAPLPAPAPAPVPYVPPTMPAPTVVAPQPADPPATVPTPATAPPAAVPATVGGAGSAADGSLVIPLAEAADGGLSMRLTGCHALGRWDVQCEFKFTNRTGRDLKLVIEPYKVRAVGEDGSRSGMGAVRIGDREQRMSAGTQRTTVDVVAGVSPTVGLTFHMVPNTMLSIKRLEVSLGARIGGEAEIQAFTFKDVPIQGR